MAWYPLLFALGACLGSFINVVSLRLPALLDGQLANGDRADVPGLIRPGSRCTACLTPLRFYQNIPIASFIFLSGKCGFCGIRISLRYPVIEVIAALSVVMLGVVYEPGWQLAAVMLFVCALLTLSLIDIDHQVLPDLLVLPLLWTGLLFNSLSLFVDLHSAVFGAVAGYLMLWLSCQAHHILTGKAGMAVEISNCSPRLAPGSMYRCCRSCLRWPVSPVCYSWCTASVFRVRLCGFLYVSAPSCHWLRLQRY